MALDSELLDKFERDWNDALAHYEARTTAARLGDTSVAPYNRTTLDPAISSGMQSELFGPLQAKWGLLTGGRGRASSAIAPQSERLFQTRDGVFAVNPATMKSRKVIDVPRAAGGAASGASKISVGDRALLNAFAKSLAESSTLASDPNASPAMRKREEGRRDAIAAQMAAIEAKYASTANSPASGAAFEAKFAQRPSEMMRQRPTPRMFMGDPMAFQGPQVPADWVSPGLLYEDDAEQVASRDIVEGVPFQMRGRGGAVTQGIDFSGRAPVDSSFEETLSAPSGPPPMPEGAQMFMGDPMNPVIQDPPMAQLPTGPSVSRGLRILKIRPTEGR